MTNFICSVCKKEESLTMIQGTVICTTCLEKVTKEAKDKEETLITSMADKIIKENTLEDIYD